MPDSRMMLRRSHIATLGLLLDVVFVVFVIFAVRLAGFVSAQAGAGGGAEMEVAGAIHRRRNSRSSLPWCGGRPGSMTNDWKIRSMNSTS